MALFRKKNTEKRSDVGVTFLSLKSPGVLASQGYHRLSEAPEVAAAIWIIADLVSSAPIHLMENASNGDIRVRDALARKIDVDPWSLGTRQTWVHWIVETELTDGEAVVIPKTAGLMLADLIPAVDASLYRPAGSQSYLAKYNGFDFDADNILHFRLRPDPLQPWRGVGPQIQLQQVVDSIIQTAETKTAYMSSEYKPPVVISVNSDSPLSDPEKRSKFIDKYMKRKDKSEPLVVPADLMNFQQVKPLSLTDLAIRDGVELDKKTVASIFGIPPFLLGVGAFNKEEYNTFISRTIIPICRGIEQELTKKLLYSQERYFRFSTRRLYSYSLKELSEISLQMRNAGLMTGNEGRNWLDLPPKDGLDDLVMLENYLPADRLGDQKKLYNEPKEDPENA
ncbi:MAG: phage portal protein [Oscillospiraceae bacterium]|nr:phage portal protein [Oscillospiraceae bacterium]